MAIFILFILLCAGGLISLLVSFFVTDYRPAWIGSGISAILIGLLVLFAGGINSVPARSIGIPVSFGKVGNSLNPGFHWMMPWVSVAEVSKTVHTISFKGDGTQAGTSSAPGNISGPCLDVRIGGQQTACLDITVQYEVTDAGAPVLYQDYTGQGSDIMDTVARNLIVREEEQVINQVLGDYNPIQDVSAAATSGNSQFSTFGSQVLADMRADLAGKVQVISVLMPLLRYDSATQARLNQIQQHYGATAIANQEILTNQAQAKANAAIASSIAHDPGVLDYQCLQITQEILKDGGSLPAGWNCFGSSSSLALSGK